MQVELLELCRNNKKIRLYLPKFSDIFSLRKETIEHKISQRLDAKKCKNYIEADKIRNTLKEQGISLLDQKDGTTTWVEDSILGTLLLRLEFNAPHYQGDPNYWYIPKPYSFEIYSNSLDKVWIEAFNNDLDSLFNNFYLATDFVLYSRDEKHYLTNDWNNITQTMLVGGKWEDEI